MAAVGRALPSQANDLGQLRDQLKQALRELEHADSKLDKLTEIRDAAPFISHLAEAKDGVLVSLITEFDDSPFSLRTKMASILDTLPESGGISDTGLTWSNAIKLFDPVLRPLRKIIAILTASVRNEFQLLARNQEQNRATVDGNR